MRRPALLFVLFALITSIGAMPARGQETDELALGQQALDQGDADTARRLWEAAAARNVQGAYPLLVRLHEDGPEKDVPEAYKWAWIGMSRTWDPAFRKSASADYDRLQEAALRYQRQDGRERADRWLEANPLPNAAP